MRSAAQSLKARSKRSRGFTLLELLIVLFLLSLGYVSLYSAGLGQTDDTDDYASAVAENQQVLRYARQLAIAKGQPVAFSIDSASIQLFASDGTTAVPSPFKINEAYSVVSSHVLTSSSQLRYDDITPTQLYFDAAGRLTATTAPSLTHAPLKQSLTLMMRNDSGVDEPYLLISNVTGELIYGG